ncbi:MAG: PorT family protein [Flavobacteriales bacterium]|nr:PorT family protein [Flavobacteriales bacterium]
MKCFIKLTLVALLASASLTTLHAQELRLGGGYNSSNVRESGTEKWVGRAGYQLGVDLLIGQRLFVKPGIHLHVRNLRYTTIGIGQDGQPNGTENEFRYTSNSLRVPVLVGVRLLQPSEENDFNMYAMAGPTALIGMKADLNNNALNITTRNTQWYLGIGAGFEYKFLFLEAGYDVAMTNVFEGDGINTNPKVNNAYIAAGLGFMLKH